MLPASTINLLDRLADLAGRSGEAVEGNCYTYHCSTTVAPELAAKQANLTLFGSKHKRILEIGFNAGHSAALFLTANPELRLTCVDIGLHSYVKPCYELLRETFGDRITLIISSSLELTAKLDKSYYKTFDGVHVDGNHEHPWYIYDTMSCLRYLADSAEFIMDDTNLDQIPRWVNFLRNSILFGPADGYQATQLYQHEILRFERPRVTVATMVVGEEYSQRVAPATQSLLEYCDYWGLELVKVTESLDLDRPIPWSKIKLLQRLAASGLALPLNAGAASGLAGTANGQPDQTLTEPPQQHHVLVWLDADIVITNKQHSLDERMLFLTANKDFLFARDQLSPVNSGSFLMHNTATARAFLDKVYQQTQCIHHGWWEQAAMNELFSRDSSRAIILPINQAPVINAYSLWQDAARHQPEHWLHHFCGFRGDKLQEGIAQAYQEASQRDFKGLNQANLTSLVKIVESLW